MTHRRVERALLIDADDTLWENNILYLRCAAQFEEFMASLGFERDAVGETLAACETDVIPTYGYGPDGFVVSLGLACERLMRQRGQEAGPALLDKARSFGEATLSPPMVLIPGVEPTLTALRPSTLLAMVTKGGEQTQHSKIERSGLGPLFDALYVVPEKDTHTYRRIVSDLALDRSCTWMVGNSPRSDINPATEVGLGGIFIPNDHTWMAEEQDILRPEMVVRLQRFVDLLGFFGIDTPD